MNEFDFDQWVAAILESEELFPANETSDPLEEYEEELVYHINHFEV